MKRIVTWIILTLLLAGVFALAFDAKPARAAGETIIINSDGSISPSWAPISSPDNITYTLTGDVSYPTYYGISVQRNTVVIDGNGHKVEGNNSGYGFALSYMNGVTIKNTSIRNFNYGIFLYHCSGNVLSENNLTANSNSSIVLFQTSSNNTVIDNTASNSPYGILLYFSSSNLIFHNNFLYNTYQAYLYSSINTWDNGYPLGGNFWSNYNGSDYFRGVYQTMNGSDGIGDISYLVGTNNTDHYPLMGRCGSTVSVGSNVAVFPSQDVGLIFSNVVAAGEVILSKTLIVMAPALTGLVGEYYDVKVSANSSGMIMVRIIYDDSGIPDESSLQMMQYTPIPGDIRPDYGTIDMRDIAYIARRFGILPGNPLWDPVADINHDEKINMIDIGTAARFFGMTSEWTNITLNIDTVNNVIYGETTHFSLIGIH